MEGIKEINRSYKTETLFSVPLFLSVFPNKETAKDTLVPILKKLEKSDINPYYYNNGYTSYKRDKSILDKKEFIELKIFIENFSQKVTNDIGITNQIVLSNSWFTINRINSYHETHNHIPNLWSGVYYVQCQENDASIVFLNKNLESNWPYVDPAVLNTFNSSAYRFVPKTGDLILFPSFLEHKVDQQKNDNERISIAFNFSIKN